jgi:SAM-dependent methyltransferase
MDVLPAEAEKLRQLVQTWSDHDTYELESTFGVGGHVDATAFFAVAQRLRSKGYEPLVQEDKLNIILPERIRFSLVGSGLVQQYCRDDTLSGKPFIAIIKDRTFIESNLDLDEYDTRIKLRREQEIGNDDPRVREVMERWAVHRKAFRLIRRWSFKGKGIVFDLSIVRSSAMDARGDFKWVRSFKEYNFLKAPPTYEIEVELLRSDLTNTDKAVADIVRGIGEVLRGLQNNSLLLRKSVKARVLSNYKVLTGSDAFRGVSPVTLEMRNMVAVPEDGVPNIRNSYNVTDKADGLRVLAFCDRKGELFMIDMGLNVYKTGLQRESCRDSLLDGEWVTKDKKGAGISQLLIFDIYIAPGSVKVDDKPFVMGDADGKAKLEAAGSEDPDARYPQLRRWMNLWNEGSGPTIVAPGVNPANKLLVGEKTFYFASGNGIFRLAARTLDKERPYYTDGLIFTPNSLALPARAGDTFKEQFKWKPAHDNTIDFLVNFEKSVESPDVDKVTIGINPSTNETVRYKTMRLKVGSSKTAAEEDPRAAILFGQSFVDSRRNGKRDTYRPILFNPADFPDTMAATCYRAVELDFETGDEFVLTEGSEEPIRDRSIVEMAYDPTKEPGWRWVPLRVRHDKTERLQRGIIARTLNSEKVGNSVWNSIHEPITESMIKTGAEEPTAEEIAAISASRAGMEDIEKKYYVRTGQKEDLAAVRGLRDFHNKYIKEGILLRVGLRGGGKRLLDIGCGKAGDLQKWRRGNVAFVLGVDPAGENILDPVNGAYARYVQTAAGKPEGTVPPMVFAIGDCSKPLVDGTAGVTPEERDILRSVFGRVKPEGAIPPFLETTAAGALRANADVVTAMFTLHYFFQSREMFDGLLSNLNDTVKIGGYFVGCCFDGDAVFNLLRPLRPGQSKVGKDGDVPLWTITKEYDAAELVPDDEHGFGNAIDVEFISIGTKQREFLVPFDLLQEKMKTIGFRLMMGDELKQVNLDNSTNMFGVSYGMATKKENKFTMEKAVKEFSFMNRWFIFKRTSTQTKVEEEQKVDEEELEGLVAAVSEAQTMEAANGIAGINAGAPRAATLAMAGTMAPGSEPVAIKSESVAAAATAAASAIPNTGVSTIKLRRKPTVAAAASTGQASELPPGQTTGQEPIREVPVSAPVAKGRAFALAELFQFYPGAAMKDILKIGEPDAGRWLAPSAPFPIKDPEDGVVYPTVEHYYAAMKYKKAAGRPDLAISLMSSRDGMIHQKYLLLRQSETGAGSRALSQDRDMELTRLEINDVKLESRPQAIISHGALYNDAAWIAAKDAALTEALTYRWTHDKKFRKIVEAARNAGKYLLYYTGTGSGSELGGKRASDTGLIDGANKMGEIIMRLANFPAF